MINLDVLSVIASIILVFGFGYGAKKLGIVKKEDAHVLNNIIIYIALPALIFMAIYRAKLSASFLYVSAIALLTTSILVGLAYLAARFFKLDKTLTGTFMLVAAVGNTGYIAYPLLISLFGEKGFVRGIFYDMFGTVIFMLTAGLFICARYGGGSEKPPIFRQLLTYPPLLALVLGFLFKAAVLPDVLIRSFDIMAAVTVGLILISIGIYIEPAKGARKYYPLIGLAFFYKLLLSPMIALGLASAFKIQPLSINTTVLSASMPTALLALIFGIKYRLNVEFMASAVFILTVSSIVTVPVIQILLT